MLVSVKDESRYSCLSTAFIGCIGMCVGCIVWSTVNIKDVTHFVIFSVTSAPSKKKWIDPFKKPKKSKPLLESAPPQGRAELPCPTSGNTLAHQDAVPTKVLSQSAAPKAMPTGGKVPTYDSPPEGGGLSNVQPCKKLKKGPEGVMRGGPEGVMRSGPEGVVKGGSDVITTHDVSSPAPKMGRPRSSSLPVPQPVQHHRPPEVKGNVGGSLMELEAPEASPPGGNMQLPSLGPRPTRDRFLTKKQLLATEERAADPTPSRPPVLSSKPPLPPVMMMDTSPQHRPKQRKKPRPTPAPNNAHPLDDSNSSEDSALEELHPLSNPEQGMKEVFRLLSNEDWNTKCDGLLTVRRLAMYHCEVLLPQLHSVVIAAEKEVSACLRGSGD